MRFLRQLVEGRFGPVTLIAEKLLPSLASVVWNHRDRGALRYIAARSCAPSRAATSPAALRGGFLLGQCNTERVLGVRLLPPQKRLASHAAALRVLPPSIKRAHGGGTAAPLYYRPLQLVGTPQGDGGCHSSPVAGLADNRESSFAMVRSVSVQPDPAIHSRIIAGKGIPHRGHAPPLRLQGRPEPEGRETPVDLNPAAREPEPARIRPPRRS